jgi:hypothetical protein
METIANSENNRVKRGLKGQCGKGRSGKIF